LPRIVGLGNATELLMTGDFISAQRAYEIGLYNKVVAENDLSARTSDYASRLASGPSLGLAVTKRMLNAEASMTLADALQAEAWIQAECMKHPDYQESYAAFLEKRPPDFVKNSAAPRAPTSKRTNPLSAATTTERVQSASKSAHPGDERRTRSAAKPAASAPKNVRARTASERERSKPSVRARAPRKGRKA
jgi:hypothetical protein